MMSKKHTPGPWAVDSYDGKTTRDIVDSRGIVICAVGNTSLEDDANQILIAAAPALLYDLREAAATLRRYEALHLAKNTPESFAKAEVNGLMAQRFEATIAKATEVPA